MGFKVVVEKGNLRFDSAHFITYAGKCERLHGHNYGVSVALEGSLTEDSYVFDFVVLKDIIRRTTEALDHRFLLPTENADLQVREEGDHLEIRFEDRRYVFPARDVVHLPVDNITAERLAQHIWGKIYEALQSDDTGNLTRITVGVEEAPGQTAYYSQDLS